MIKSIIEMITDLHVEIFAVKEAFWFIIFSGLVFGATLIDLSSGVATARALKQKIYSGGFRKSFVKMNDYLSILYFGVVVDVALFLAWDYMPIGLALTAIAASAIEFYSVIENMRLKKSAAAKIPEIMEKMIRVTNKEQAADLMKEMSEISKKSGKCEEK